MKTLSILSVSIFLMVKPIMAAQLDAPGLAPASGTLFIDSLKVALAPPMGADAYYTLDGTTPSTSSKKYTGVFSITASTALKAKSVRKGFQDSVIITANYKKVPPPQDNVKAQNYNYALKRWDTFKANDTLFVTTDPFMPQISIQNAVSGGLGSPVRTYWKFDSIHPTSLGDTRKVDDHHFPTTGFTTTPYDQAWVVSKNFVDFFGGDGTFTFYDNVTMPQRTFLCKIRGSNPTRDVVWKYAAAKGAPWFFKAMLQQESTYNQFQISAQLSGLPLFGPPNGWGIAQIDRGTKGVTTTEAWNWQSNVSSALDILREKHGYTVGYFASIKKRYAQAWEEPPTNFKVPGTTVTLSATDASDITLYNGGSAVDGIYPTCWKFFDTNPAGKRWVYMKNSKDYLYNVALIIQKGI